MSLDIAAKDIYFSDYVYIFTLCKIGNMFKKCGFGCWNAQELSRDAREGNKWCVMSDALELTVWRRYWTYRFLTHHSTLPGPRARFPPASCGLQVNDNVDRTRPVAPCALDSPESLASPSRGCSSSASPLLHEPPVRHMGSQGLDVASPALLQVWPALHSQHCFPSSCFSPSPTPVTDRTAPHWVSLWVQRPCPGWLIASQLS